MSGGGKVRSWADGFACLGRLQGGHSYLKCSIGVVGKLGSSSSISYLVIVTKGLLSFQIEDAEASSHSKSNFPNFTTFARVMS